MARAMGDFSFKTSPNQTAIVYTCRTCLVQTFGHAGTNLGRAAGRDLFICGLQDAGGGAGHGGLLLQDRP